MGAGLCTVVTPPEVAGVYKAFSASLMVEPCDEIARFKDHLKDQRRNVVVIGPGAGRDNPAGLKKAALDAIQMTPCKVCILDADALTVFGDDPKVLCRATGPHCILTPHEGEFERLFPELEGSKADRAQAAASKSRAIIVLKGHETIIASPEGRYVVNSNGTGWLATAGTGDVLAGMIAGLAARLIEGLSLFEAVCAAVWMHADAAARFGPGLISEDLPNLLPAVWADLLERKYKSKKN
jgi:NAD(P)H-hydrate epimerase